jgi:hypothetical protein
MLRPMPIEPLPPETTRVARAAFPKGNRYLRLADALATLFTDDAFLALFSTHGQPALLDNPRCPRGGWRSSRSCNSLKGSPIAKRSMPSGVASTGNMGCAWSSRIPDSMRQSSASFAPASALGRRSRCSSTPYSRGAATANSSSRGGGSGRTPPMCWRRCGP